MPKVIALKSKCLFTSQPTGATEYAIREDGAVFFRTTSRPEGGYPKTTKWARRSNVHLAKFLRETEYAHLSVRGVHLTKRTTTRLQLPQDLGV
jgi:hypothetical protein